MQKQTFDKIKNKVMRHSQNTNDPQHDFDHFQRVARNALQIVKYLQLESKVDLILLKTCCYVHDCHVFFMRPSFYTHFFEVSCLKKILPGFLEEFDIPEHEKKTIFRAVYNHPYSFTYGKLNKKGDLYTKILQDADTIDYLSDERLENLKLSKKFFHYRIASLIAKPFVMMNRKSIRRVLNFPSLSRFFYV